MESITGVDIDLGNDRKLSANKLPLPVVSSSALSNSPRTKFSSTVDEDLDLVENTANKEQDTSELFAALDQALTSTENTAKKTSQRSDHNVQLPMFLLRTFARLVDFLWEISVAWLLVRMVLPIDTMSVLSKVLIIPCALLAVALLLDLLVQGLLGNTPGKKLLGIQATTWGGSQLSLRESFERNFLLWRFGFLFGVVPLIPFTALKQWMLVFKGKRTHYDERLHLRVKSSKRPVWLSVLATAVAITFLSLPVSHFVYGQPLVSGMFSGTGFDSWSDIIRKRLDTSALLGTESPAPDSINDRVEVSTVRSVLAPNIDRDTTLILLKGPTNLPSSVPLPTVLPRIESVTLPRPFSPVTLRGMSPVPPHAALVTASQGATTIPLLPEAPDLSVTISPDSMMEADANQGWTNPYSGLSTEIDIKWKNEVKTSDQSSGSVVFRHVGTESILTLDRIGSTALTVKMMAEQFIAEQTDFALTEHRGKISVGELSGWKVVAQPDSAGTIRNSEWVRIDDVVYRMELITQPAVQQSAERLKAIVWSTFL